MCIRDRLRTAYHTVTSENPEIGEQSPLKVLRQIGSFKELEIDIKGVKLHCAALSSLGEARRLIQAMKRGECHYEDVYKRQPCGRVNLTERPAGERKCDFTLTECGMSLKEAGQEARRCLRCDHFGYGTVSYTHLHYNNTRRQRPSRELAVFFS